MANGTVTQKVVDENDQAKAGLLDLIAEGKPYVFLTAEISENDEGDETVVTNLMSVLPAHVTKAILEMALESVESVL